VRPSIQQLGEVLRFDTYLGWSDPILAYLKDGVLPDNKTETQKLQHMVNRYILLGDALRS